MKFLKNLKEHGIRIPLKIGIRKLCLQLLTRLNGVDISDIARITDEYWEVDQGIKFPAPLNQSDTKLLIGDFMKIVIPSLLRRRIANFDRQYGIICVGQETPYEIEGVSVETGDVVLDCGANMGVFSAVAAHHGGTVHAFEVMPYTYNNYLLRTASMNETKSGGTGIYTHDVAVWDKEETLTFKYDPNGIQGPSCVTVDKKNKTEDFSVSAITLDSFVEKNNIERVDFIKADIEGAERNMLRGAKNILQRFSPKLSICTYHLKDDPQVIREIILQTNPKYVIQQKYKKLFAHVPKS